MRRFYSHTFAHDPGTCLRELLADRSASYRTTRLVVHADDEQLAWVALVVDAEGRNRSAPYERAGTEAGDGTLEFASSQTLDVSRDVFLEVCCGSRVAFDEVGDRVEDVSDRFF